MESETKPDYHTDLMQIQNILLDQQEAMKHLFKAIHQITDYMQAVQEGLTSVHERLRRVERNLYIPRVHEQEDPGDLSD